MNDLGDPMETLDASLVRYLDGLPDAPEAARIEAMLAETPSARARLADLTEASRRFAGAAASVPTPPTPSLRLVRPRWRTRAATIGLLLTAGAAAAMPTTRAGIRAGVEQLLGVGAPPPPVRTTDTSGRARVAIPVVGETFAIEVENPRPGTWLRFEPSNDGRLIVDGGGHEIVVLPGAVRLVGEASEDIVVGLPASLRTLRLGLGAGAARTIPLQPGVVPDALRLGPGRD